MSLSFFLIAGVMLAGALALVVFPLLRGGTSASEHKRRLDALDRALSEGVLDEAEFGRKRKALLLEPAPAAAPRAPLAAVLGLALMLPLGAILVYLTIGTPAALDPAVADAPPVADAGHGDSQGAPMQMDEAIAGLQKRLESEPDNLDGWMLLGRAYKSTERFTEARDALKHAFDIAPNNPEVVSEYAEAIALSNPERTITADARALLEQVLIDAPLHQRALWLLGIADAQEGKYNAAIARWETLLPTLPADSDVLPQVKAQLAEARRLAGLPPKPEDAAALAAVAESPEAGGSAQADAGTPPPAAASAGPTLTVEVDIAPELLAKLEPTDVVYVFARAAEGPRMPLALQRLPGAKFPLTVTLDDNSGMMPTMKLSSFPRVVVGARVSKSGVANAQTGDLETLSQPFTTLEQKSPLKLVIDRIVP